MLLFITYNFLWFLWRINAHELRVFTSTRNFIFYGSYEGLTLSLQSSFGFFCIYFLWFLWRINAFLRFPILVLTLLIFYGSYEGLTPRTYRIIRCNKFIIFYGSYEGLTLRYALRVVELSNPHFLWFLWRINAICHGRYYLVFKEFFMVLMKD